MRTVVDIVVAQLCILLLAIAPILCTQPDEIASDEVNIQPGGQVHTFEKAILGGVTCKFTYIAQGGTNERWSIQVSHSKDNRKYGCSVHRPEGRSYLFFMSFEMEIKGAHIISSSVNGNSGPLNPDEYRVDEKKHIVSHVEGKFQSQLTQVEIRAQKGKSEL